MLGDVAEPDRLPQPVLTASVSNAPLVSLSEGGKSGMSVWGWYTFMGRGDSQ